VPSAPTPKVIQAHKPVVVALQQVEVQFDALKREIDSVVNMEVSLTKNLTSMDLRIRFLNQSLKLAALVDKLKPAIAVLVKNAQSSNRVASVEAK